MLHHQSSGPERLPGELDAVFSSESPDEEPVVAVPREASAPDRFTAVVGRLRADVDELVELAGDPGLALADSDVLIAWAQELERSRNRLQIPDQCWSI